MDSCLGRMIFNSALTVIIIAVIAIFASTGSKSKKIDPLEVPPGASVNQSQDETYTRSGLLSGNSVNIVPQINIASDVKNCLGDYSCMTVVISSTETSSSSLVGDRKTVVQSDGQVACEDPQHPNQYATTYCPQEGKDD